MDMLIAVRLVRLTLGVLLIWAIFYLSIRAFLLDNLRQNLFAIRDDLFDFAADDGISFDDSSYRELRDDLNSLIRFANKVSMLRLLLAQFFGGPTDSTKIKNWIERVNQLPPLAKRKLISARMAALRELMLYILRLRSCFCWSIG